ncbi:MAG: hydrogenase maturation protease [Dehalococcoidia bacterium]
MKTLILGLGNSIRCDDGVGNRVAQALEEEFHGSSVKVMEANADGLALLDLLPGYDRAIIIDAIETPQGTPGQIYRLDKQELISYDYAPTTHNIGIGTALQLGTKLGIPLPEEVIIFAVEVGDIISFSQELTPQVEEAVPRVIELILQEVAQKSPEH